MPETDYPIPVDPDIESWIASLDDNSRELFNERAGIREQDGGLTRRQIELAAYADVLCKLNPKHRI